MTKYYLIMNKLSFDNFSEELCNYKVLDDTVVS